MRGIISCKGAPTEKLAGLVDHFLQPGMKQLPSFLKDTKDTLQIIENMNEKIESGEFSLEGVALMTLDVDKMYNNMTEELGLTGCRKYLESRSEQEVSTELIMKGLELCIRNNFFKFNGKAYQQIGGVGTGVKLAPLMHALGRGNLRKQHLRTINTNWQISFYYGRDLLMMYLGYSKEAKLSLKNMLIG